MLQYTKKKLQTQQSSLYKDGIRK